MMKYLEFSGVIIPTDPAYSQNIFTVGQWDLFTHVDIFDYSHIVVYFLFLCDNIHYGLFISIVPMSQIE